MQSHQSFSAVAEERNMNEACCLNQYSARYSSQNHSVRVLIHSITKSTFQAVLVLSGILGTGWDTVNDPKGEFINGALHSAENSSDWRVERGQAQKAMLANHRLQKLLVNHNKLLFSLVWLETTITLRITYASERSANGLLLGVTIGRSGLSLLSKNFRWILNNFRNTLQTFPKVLLQTILTSLKGALAVHSSNVICGSFIDLLEVVDHLLEFQLASVYYSEGYDIIVIMLKGTHHTGVVLKRFVTEILLAISLVSDES